MNKRQFKKKEKNTFLFLGQKLYMTPKEQKRFCKLPRGKQAEYLYHLWQDAKPKGDVSPPRATKKKY